MGIDTYYLTKKDVTGIGGLFLVNELQQADAGGEDLLGSVVQENKSAFHTDYPVPLLVSEPSVFVNKLNKFKTELNITADVIQKQNIAAGNKNITVNKSNSFNIGLGPFPAIPFNGKFQLDYSRVSTISIAYGAGTMYKYLRKGDLMKLYTKLGGKPDADLTGKFLEKNAFISLIQLAKNWTVSFESTQTFNADVAAQIKLFNQDNTIGGGVKMDKKTDTKIEAAVAGDTYYVVGLMSTRWSDINPG